MSYALGPMALLVVDRERFLLLSAAIAAAHCAPVPRAQGGSSAIQEPPPAPYATVVVLPAAQGQTAEEPRVEVPPPEDPAVAEPAGSDSGCRNEDGVVSCDFITARRFGGPACEGFRGSCDLLKQGYGYKPRVAAAIASCWERVGPSACNMSVRRRCIREGLHAACPDPQFIAYCEDALDRCRQRRMRPDFDVGECVQALSSLEGGELDWAKGAIGPSAEGCKLMFPVY